MRGRGRERVGGSPAVERAVVLRLAGPRHQGMLPMRMGSRPIWDPRLSGPHRCRAPRAPSYCGDPAQREPDMVRRPQCRCAVPDVDGSKNEPWPDPVARHIPHQALKLRSDMRFHTTYGGKCPCRIPDVESALVDARQARDSPVRAGVSGLSAPIPSRAGSAILTPRLARQGNIGRASSWSSTRERLKEADK